VTLLDSAYARGDYDWVYANYVDHSHYDDAVEHIFRERSWVGAPAIRHALDLCAGTGVMTHQLVFDHYIDNVLAVDKSPAMLEALTHRVPQARRLVQDLNDPAAYGVLKHQLPEGGVDLITCRQGIGYLHGSFLRQIPSLLAPGGVFVFNTFEEPRLTRLRRRDGILEAGVYLPPFRRVIHLQVRWPRFDVTTFVWHDYIALAKMWGKVGLEVTLGGQNRSWVLEVARRFE